MARILKKPLKKTLSQTEEQGKLTPETQYWGEVNQTALWRITELVETLFPWLPKNNPEHENRIKTANTYQNLLSDYQNQDEWPDDPSETAEQIAYEYWLKTVERAVLILSRLPFYEPEHLEDLTE